MSIFTIIILFFARLALLFVWVLTTLVYVLVYSLWKRCGRLGLALGLPGIPF